MQFWSACMVHLAMTVADTLQENPGRLKGKVSWEIENESINPTIAGSIVLLRLLWHNLQNDLRMHFALKSDIVAEIRHESVAGEPVAVFLNKCLLLPFVELHHVIIKP
jgi:hypothetical protein